MALNGKITRISIHATDNHEGCPLDLVALRRDHVRRGFGNIGYHYVIGPKGDIHLTRAVTVRPCVVKGYNQGMIGIAYWGGMVAHGTKAKDTRTPEQRVAMAHLVSLLAHRYGIAASHIIGHRDLDYLDRNHDHRPQPSEWLKLCPCFEVSAEREGWLRDH